MRNAFVWYFELLWNVGVGYVTTRDTKSMARLDYSLGGKIVKCHSEATKREAEESRRELLTKTLKLPLCFISKWFLRGAY